MITPSMLDALRDRLQERPDLYLDEMVEFLWEEYHVILNVHSQPGASIDRVVQKGIPPSSQGTKPGLA